MKKICLIKKICVLLITIFALNSKANESIPRLPDEQFEKIGELHNKSLENCFNLLISKKQDFKDRVSMFSVIKEDNVFDFKLENEIPFDKEGLKVEIKEFQAAESQLHQIFESTSTYSELESKIESQIQQIKSNSKLSNIDYNSIMAMYYVAKYSANFWYGNKEGGSGKGDAYIKQVSEIYPSMFSSSGSNETPLDKKNIAEADAVGAAVGGLRWCAATIWTGAGSVGGFCAGLVIGGASASFQAWCLGIDMEPMCMNKEPFDYSSIKDVKTDADYREYIMGAVLDVLCCYKTSFKASYCDKYKIIIDQN